MRRLLGKEEGKPIMNTFIWIVVAIGALVLSVAVLMFAAIAWEESKAAEARKQEKHLLELEETRQIMRLREQGNPFV